MKVKLNGLEKIFADNQNLEQIIIQFCKDTQRVIAEVNGEIVKQPRWEETQIQEGDSVELVSFVGGG